MSRKQLCEQLAKWVVFPFLWLVYWDQCFPTILDSQLADQPFNHRTCVWKYCTGGIVLWESCEQVVCGYRIKKKDREKKRSNAPYSVLLLLVYFLKWYKPRIFGLSLISDLDVGFLVWSFPTAGLRSSKSSEMHWNLSLCKIRMFQMCFSVWGYHLKHMVLVDLNHHSWCVISSLANLWFLSYVNRWFFSL